MEGKKPHFKKLLSSGLFYSIISSHQFFELFLSQIFYVILFIVKSVLFLHIQVL